MCNIFILSTSCTVFFTPATKSIAVRVAKNQRYHGVHFSPTIVTQLLMIETSQGRHIIDKRPNFDVRMIYLIPSSWLAHKATSKIVHPLMHHQNLLLPTCIVSSIYDCYGAGIVLFTRYICTSAMSILCWAIWIRLFTPSIHKICIKISSFTIRPHEHYYLHPNCPTTY